MKKLTHRRVYIQPSNKCIVINTDGLICDPSVGTVTGDSGSGEGWNPRDPGEGRIQDFFIESDED